MKSVVNFHIHTVFSDGGKTVGEIVQGLKDSGVKYFAITDHDRVGGNIEAASVSLNMNRWRDLRKSYSAAKTNRLR